MARKHSISEARMKLPRLVRDAEEGKAVELTRRGEAVAVLVGRREYERLVARSRRFSEAWKDFASAVDLDDLQIDPDEVFGTTRDRRPGRGADL
ncbi:MAG TPA: type II toxin-antitoxin system Phd/YefM family antitoxin [Thermoanaerobaculia bacterium]|nr:type II toxin-antitoxin system Phd/YefM family antitoxin [Thermoanaerobaculia bacterium]